MKIKDCAFVLEGGGMRGAFTAGIIDYLLQNNIYFEQLYGVSAGANNAANYCSRQRVRNKKLFTELVEDKRYMGIKNLIKNGSYFGMDFLFHKLPREVLPFDYQAFKNSSSNLKVAVTACESGEVEYFSPQKFESNEKIDKLFKASSSLPLMASPVEIEGKAYLDGGIKDSIPVKKALADGYKKVFVILTRPKDYRKSPLKAKFILDLFLKKYPNLVEGLKTRHLNYNKTLELIEEKEDKGEFFVFRPKDLEIDRFTKDVDQLKDLYSRGHDLALEKAEELKNWLKI
ncbi:patatin-like phospholipase family protein [Halanaerobium hydrogeniformans]|uniref:Patatin n=1 Tax=Halanaerobium hydrogeniformans TaxID=656519 RepID=E4RPH3_HALHG|nr:patatin family protein [Halanaerobium hydrogeniformans]ADQ13996.1 Patatin [Halanaerobium hydrogeniformans]